MFFDGRKIKRIREKKKITRKELADHVNISYSTLKNWELGKKEPYNLSIMNQIAEYLDCDLREFLTEKQELAVSQKETFTEREFQILDEAIELIGKDKMELKEKLQRKLKILKEKQESNTTQ